MLLFLIVAALLIALSAVIFALQNADIILVSFLAWQFQGSMALILLLTFILGFIAALLILLPRLIKSSFYVPDRKNKPAEQQSPSQERQPPINENDQPQK